MTRSPVLSLAEIPLGRKARIERFTSEYLSLKFLEMGCLPGEEVSIYRIAPFGDPIAVIVSGYILSMRLEEASTIEVTLID